MNYCKKCGSKLADGNLFCNNCGNKVEHIIQEPEIVDVDDFDKNVNVFSQNIKTEAKPNLIDKFCEKCRNRIDDNELFCKSCGNRLNNVSSQQSNNQDINNYMGPKNTEPEVQLNNNVYKKDNKKKIILISAVSVFALFVLIIPFLLFGKDKDYTRTIMLYVVGSNLESGGGLATVDLDSIDYNKMDSENVNVVMIAGGTQKWFNDYIDTDETSIYELTSSGFEKVKEQKVQNMGSADVFSDFLNYVYENYKTDKYDLIFWNHGSAIYGSEVDELSDDILSLEEMEKGLSQTAFNEDNKIENVIFRTCLNGTIEVADVFDDYADYLIASEEITYGSAYTSVLNFINDISPSDDNYEVGKKYIDAYKKQISEMKDLSGQYIYSTYSIMDLSNVESLVENLNDFVNDIDISSNYNAIAKVRSNLYQYGYDQGGDSSFDMVDLYNLIDGIKELSPSKGQKVLDEIEETVIYNYATNDKSRGISVYFPFNGTKLAQSMFLGIYNKLDSFNGYNKFISKFNSIQSGTSKSYSFTSNKVSTSENKGGSDFTLELTDEQKEGFARAEYIVFRDNKDGYYQPIYRGRKVSLDNNTLKASIADRQLKVVATNEENMETLFPLIEVESEDDYIKYKTNVLLKDYSAEDISDWKYDVAELALLYEKNKGNVEIINSVLVNDDELLPNSMPVDLNDYGNIDFVSSKYKITDDNGNYLQVDDWISNGVIEGISVDRGYYKFELQNFDDGNDYYCVFMIYDTNNNVHYSKLVKMN